MALNQWLRGCSAAVALSTFLATAAYSGAPQVKTQSPGYYRMMLGDFEVTALSDGTAALQVTKLLTNTTVAKVKEALTHS